MNQCPSESFAKERECVCNNRPLGKEKICAQVKMKKKGKKRSCTPSRGCKGIEAVEPG